MILSSRSRNRMAKHFLLRWYDYDTTYPDLSEIEMDRMKALYVSLKQMDAEEQQFLADKYHVPKSTRTGKSEVPDREAAELRSLSLVQYRKERIRLESTLQHLLEEQEA